MSNRSNVVVLSEEAKMTQYLIDRKNSGKKKQQNRKKGKKVVKWFDRLD